MSAASLKINNFVNVKGWQLVQTADYHCVDVHSYLDALVVERVMEG